MGGHRRTDLARLRHEIAHDLSSPVRGTAIVADLLAEILETKNPDMTTVRDLSAQLSTLVTETNQRLSDFASAADE